MASTALATQQQQPTYFALLDGDPKCAPGVRNLQRWIETAWREGYDSVGAGQLKHRLAGTRKWIGTGELYVAFTYKGIPSRLVDFTRPRNGTNRDTATALVRWVVDYFSSPPSLVTPASSRPPVNWKDTPLVSVTSHMPVVLQHNGHSRTIVGYELASNGAMNLLMFDPARPIRDSLRRAALASHARLKRKHNVSPTASIPATRSSSSSTTLITKFFHKVPSNKPLSLKRVFNKNAPPDTPIIIDSDDDDSTLTPDGHDAKRARGGEDDEIVYAGSSSSKAKQKATLKKPETYPEEDELDAGHVANYFRVNIAQLSRHGEYQILYFPLTDPLTDGQKEARKVVTSERVVAQESGRH
ncbi:hypothetical protein FRB99_008734 [Tulasnella sp. 403]|nr:hypothetical protein FRB99_008734 [Tulasnella sp. 403]